VLRLLSWRLLHSGVGGAIVTCCVVVKLILCVFLSRSIDSWTFCLSAALEVSHVE